MYSEEEEGRKWTGAPSSNPYRQWYWGRELNRPDPRVPTDKDIKHAGILKMITQAVKKHRQNIGKEDAKLTIPRYVSSPQRKYPWWVSKHTV